MRLNANLISFFLVLVLSTLPSSAEEMTAKLFASVKAESTNFKRNYARKTYHKDVFKNSEFNQLNFIQEIRLASTALINPELSKQVSIIYTMDPTKFIEFSGSTQQAAAFLESGYAQVGEIKNRVVKPSKGGQLELINTWKNEDSRSDITASIDKDLVIMTRNNNDGTSNSKWFNISEPFD